MRRRTEPIPLPGVCLVEVAGSGTVLARDRADAELLLHWRDDELTPCCAELVGDDLGADIGLQWDGNKLVDYDGVAEIPKEVVKALEDRGFDCSEVTDE